MATKIKSPADLAAEETVNAVMLTNARNPATGELLLAGTLVELPRSVAIELGKRNACRKPTSEETAADPSTGDEEE